VNPEAKVVSFVLRFVYEEPPAGSAAPGTGWYSIIRHVQSDTERHLTRWEDITAFITQYVTLDKDAPHE
jgi:hypothetical protein